MAAYFWVGGSGTWDGSTTTNWATSSGGAGGAGVPTSADTVTFNSASNSPSTAYTVTMGTGAVCSDMTMTGPTTGQVTWAGTTAMSVYGSFTLSGTGANTGVSATYTGALTFATAGTASADITTNGVTLNCPITVTTTVTPGLLRTAGAFTSTAAFSVTGTSRFSFGSGTVTLLSLALSTTGLMGYNGAVVLTGSGTALNVTAYPGAQSTGGTISISLTSASPKTAIFPNSGQFSGPVLQQSGAGALTINTTTGTGTFQTSSGIKNTVSPTSILVTAGITLVADVTLNGTAGNLVTFGSTSAATFTLNPYNTSVKTSTYCSVSYVNASTSGGTVLWRFLNSTNGGNNTNITFASQYYWVGGTGTWNNSSTTNWSLTSGGSGAQGPPTSADDVYFDTASASPSTAYTVTMGTSAACFNMTMSGPTTGQVTWAGSTAMSIYGSMSLSGTAANGGVSATYSGTVTFAGTYTGLTVTTNGVSCAFSPTFNGVGGAWTLGSAFTTGSVFYLTNGTFSTSTSNYAMSVNSLILSLAGTRTLSLNGSTITTTQSGGGIDVAATGVTINAGTSQINIGSNIDSSYTFGAYTYYNVSMTGTSATTHQLLGSGTTTFNTLTVAGPVSTGLKNLVLSGNITTTTLNLNATGTYTNRLFVKSDTIGTQRSIYMSTGLNGGDCDFRDIHFTGVYVDVGGYNNGDCGGNTGLTVAAKTVYWNLAGAQNWSATGWATSSGGTPSAANFPLAQDTVVFDNTGSVTGTITVNLAWNIGTVDMSGRTSAMTLATSTNTPTVYGAWTNGSGTTLSGTGTLTFSNRSTKTINSAGKTFTQDIVIDAPGGGIQLLTNNLTSTGTGFTTGLTRGTLDLNNLTLTVAYWTSDNSNTRAISFGTTGSITIDWFGISGTLFNMPTATGFSYTGTSNITMVGASTNGRGWAFGYVANSGTESNALSFNFTNTAAVVGLGVCKNLNFSACTAGATWTCQAITVYGNVTFNSSVTVVASNSTMTFGATSGTKTITTAGQTLDFPITFNGVGGTWSLQDGMTMGSTRTLTFNNGTLNLNGTTLTVGTAFTTATGTKNLTFNGGTLVCPTASTTAFNNAVPTGFTTTAGTGTGYISMTAATAKTFVGGGTTYNCVLQQAGAGALTITGSNSFADLQATAGGQPSTISFTAGTTSTFTMFTLSGTAGNLVTIGSATAAAHTLSKSSGYVTASYLSISYSTATGGAVWYAPPSTNTNGGNNTGWQFVELPPPVSIGTGITIGGGITIG